MITAVTAESSPVASWGRLIPPMARVRLAVVAVLFSLVYWETIQHELVKRWLADGNWSHGWLIPLFSLYALNARRAELRNAIARTSWLGLVIVLLSLGAFFYSAWVVPRAYPRALSIVGTVFGLTLFLGGWRIMRVAWFPILFLALAIPLPDRLYVALTMPLRVFASQVAAALLPTVVPGLFTEAQGVVIDYVIAGRPSSLNVEEACSGMRSLMSLATLGVATAYVGDRPAWQRWIMVLSCIPIAVFCNIIRVVVTGILIIQGQTDLARGTPHAMLGVGVFALALGLFMLLGWTLNRLVVADTSEPADAATT